MQLASVSLIVPDYDVAIEFYCTQMGFELIADIDQGRKRWVEVRPPGGGGTFVLARADGADQEAIIGNQGAGRVWLFLQTENFVRDHAKLRAAGVIFEEDPRHEIYGTVAVFRDLFGNRWDLIEKKPEVSD